MKVAGYAPTQAASVDTAFSTSPAQEKEPDLFWEKALLQKAERQRDKDAEDIYETMRKRGEEELKLWKKMLEDMQKAKKQNRANARPPQVNLRGMTQRLVAAASEAEVRAVLSEAGQALSALQLALCGLEGKQRQQVQAMIQSAQKLAGRCGQKITELGQEDGARSRVKKSAKAGQKKKAESIKQELRQQEIKRAHREQAYLLEHFPSLQQRQDSLLRSGPVHPAQKLDAASEAKIEAMAEAIAAAVPESGGDFSGGEMALEGGEVGGELSAGEAAPAAAASAEGASFVQTA